MQHWRRNVSMARLFLNQAKPSDWGPYLASPEKKAVFSSRRSQFSSWTSFPPLLMNVSLTCVSGPRFKAQRDEIEQKIPERSSIPPYFSGFLSLSPQSGPGEARNYLGGIFFLLVSLFFLLRLRLSVSISYLSHLYDGGKNSDRLSVYSDDSVMHTKILLHIWEI